MIDLPPDSPLERLEPFAPPLKSLGEMVETFAAAMDWKPTFTGRHGEVLSFDEWMTLTADDLQCIVAQSAIVATREVVSTVWLRRPLLLDDDGEPTFRPFETALLTDTNTEPVERYATEEEAMVGHLRWVAARERGERSEEAGLTRHAFYQHRETGDVVVMEGPMVEEWTVFVANTNEEFTVPVGHYSAVSITNGKPFAVSPEELVMYYRSYP